MDRTRQDGPQWSALPGCIASICAVALPVLGGRAVRDSLDIVELDEFQGIEVTGDVPFVIWLVEDDIVRPYRVKNALPGNRLVWPDLEGGNDKVAYVPV